ncbi:MAG: fatty acid desaturase, partial [Acidimicrobiales bacterium]
MSISWEIDLVVGILLSQLAFFTVSIHMHRHLAHRAVTFHPAAARVLRVLTWLITGLDAQRWVAVHRTHHMYSDRPGDPHSPRLEGFLRILLGASRNSQRMYRDRELARCLAKDVVAPSIWSPLGHPWSGLATLYLALCLMMTPANALVVLGFHGLCSKTLTNALAAIGHYYGRRPYRNTATNSRLLAVVTAGEGLHNNHHACVRLAKFARQVKEIDPGWLVIRCLCAVRVATVYVPLTDAAQRR